MHIKELCSTDIYARTSAYVYTPGQGASSCIYLHIYKHMYPGKGYIDVCMRRYCAYIPGHLVVSLLDNTHRHTNTCISMQEVHGCIYIHLKYIHTRGTLVYIHTWVCCRVSTSFCSISRAPAAALSCVFVCIHSCHVLVCICPGVWRACYFHFHRLPPSEVFSMCFFNVPMWRWLWPWHPCGALHACVQAKWTVCIDGLVFQCAHVWMATKIVVCGQVCLCTPTRANNHKSEQPGLYKCTPTKANNLV